MDRHPCGPGSILAGTTVAHPNFIRRIWQDVSAGNQGATRKLASDFLKDDLSWCSLHRFSRERHQLSFGQVLIGEISSTNHWGVIGLSSYSDCVSYPSNFGYVGVPVHPNAGPARRTRTIDIPSSLHREVDRQGKGG